METFQIPAAFRPIHIRALERLVDYYEERDLQGRDRRKDEGTLRELAREALRQLGADAGACAACGRGPDATATKDEEGEP